MATSTATVALAAVATLGAAATAALAVVPPAEFTVAWTFDCFATEDGGVSPCQEDEFTSGVEPGTVVTFDWTVDGRVTPHNLWEFPDREAFDACDDLRAVEIAPMDDGSVTLALNEPGTKWYYCQIGIHCESGMRVSITVLGESESPASVPMPAVAPAPAPAPTPSPTVAPEPAPTPAPAEGPVPMPGPMPMPAPPPPPTSGAAGNSAMLAAAAAAMAGAAATLA